MATTGLVTTLGFTKSIEAAGNEGWVIRPTKFALAETRGEFLGTRSMTDLEATWHTAWISGRQVLSPNSIMFFCAVPPEQGGNQQRDINEIYLFAEDINGDSFLLWLAQPDDTVIYDPSGTTRLRLQVTIANLNIGATFQFVYTQAQEIEAHNIDPLAHPDYQERFESMGYPINFDNHAYVGQLADEVPVFAAAVEDGDIVYWDVANARYDRALADLTSKSHAIGMARISELYNAVRSGGYVQTFLHEAPYNIPNDTVIYLSAVNPGKITIDRTNIPLGIHMHSGLCFFPPSAGYLKWANIGGSGRNPVYATENIYANNLDTIMANLEGGSFTVYLPSSPRDGDIVRAIDTKGLARTNNLIVNGQGAAINNELEDFIVDVNYAILSFIYDVRENNWLVDLGGSRFTGYIE